MHFDIAIVGAGMVGKVLALALKESGFRIALVDASTPSQEDRRLIALNYNSYCLFKNLGLWTALEKTANPIEQVHVSHRGHFGLTRLFASDAQLPVLGYVIPAAAINKALNAQLSETETISLLEAHRLENITEQISHIDLQLSHQDQMRHLNSTIVVGADGSQSTVRRLLNIRATTHDYNQTALVHVTALQRSHQNIAYERFLKAGAIAMLPLCGEQVATIWSGPTEYIAHLLTLSPEAYLQALQTQFGYRLGKLVRIEKRASYPLHSLQANESAREKIVLIGNAAHTLHPIAAQGLNLALYEIAVLVDYLRNETRETIENISFKSFLSTSQRLVRSQQLSHGLAKLFSSDFFVLSTARSMGFLGLETFEKVKHYFLMKSIGHRERLPALMKGNR